MLDVETKRRIDTARDILVGKVPDPKSQVEQITIALIYKFMDDMDVEASELGGIRTFFTGDFEKFAWRSIFDPKISGHELIMLYTEAIVQLNLNPNIPQLFRDIFKNAYLPYRDPETLKSFLKVIDEFNYDHSEKLGDAFEYLLSVLGSQGSAGQFRTPRHIIDFMVEIIHPEKHETILDPACGTAGFLISSFKHILKHNSSNFEPEKEKPIFEQEVSSLSELTLNNRKFKGDKLTPDERLQLANNITGYDISPDMVRLSLVNMYLHGLNNPGIYEYDTLTSEDNWNKYADVILANPPFMSPKGGIRPHNRFSVKSNRSEVLFVDYIAEHLTPNGRAAVIVPEGIIFQSGTAYKQLRKMLVEDNLVGVISLPAGVFNPYSGVKTSILWLDKNLSKRTDNILFVKISNDGFDLGAQRRPVKQNDLPDALKAIKEYQKGLKSGQTFDADLYPPVLIADKEKVARNEDYNLSGERYKAITPHYTKYDLIELEKLFSNISNGINVKQIDNEGEYKVTRIQTISKGTVDLQAVKWTNDKVSSDYFMQNGDILLSHINSIEHLGKTAIFYSNEKVVHGINLIRLRPKIEIINPKYAISVFKNDFFIKKTKVLAQRAVNQASIRTSDLKKISIPLPPLSIQEEIVAEIESYQKIIDGARQVVENYKPQIKIDPDWEMVELGKVAKIINGRAYKQEELLEKGKYKVLRVGNFFSNRSWYYSNLELESDKYCINGDLLFAWSASFGPKIWDGEKSIFHYHIWKIEPNEAIINKQFLYFLLGLETSNIKSDGGRGIAMIHITKEGMEKRKIHIPPYRMQLQIISQIKIEQDLVKANEQLIEIYKKKIKDRIASIWGESKEYKLTNDELGIAAEP